MKYLILIIVIFALGRTVLAQKAASPKPAVSVKAAREAAREKFDPLRDPAADLQIAMAAAQKHGRRIILDVGGEWCHWCRTIDQYFSANPDLAKLRDDNFVWMKVNMSEENENKAFLSTYPEIKGYPHLFVLDSDGKFLHSQDTTPLELVIPTTRKSSRNF